MRSRISLHRGATHGSARTQETDSAVELFNAHGALWIENAFDPALIARLLKQYRKRYLNLSAGELKRRDALVGDRRFMLTVEMRGKFNRPEVYANEALMPILEQLLTPYLRIASFGSVVAMPGAEDQPIHLDHPPLFSDMQHSQANLPQFPPYALTMVIPLVDIDSDCGTTAIWEGSHRPDFTNRCGEKNENSFEMLQRLMETPDYRDAAKPLPRQGDVYLMDYRVIHGGMANRSTHDRPILYVVYSRPWFRDGFNFGTQPAVCISPKQLKKVPKRWRGLFS